MKNCHVPKVKCIFLNFTHDDLTSLDQPTPTRVYIYIYAHATLYLTLHYIDITLHCSSFLHSGIEIAWDEPRFQSCSTSYRSSEKKRVEFKHRWRNARSDWRWNTSSIHGHHPPNGENKSAIEVKGSGKIWCLTQGSIGRFWWIYSLKCQSWSQKRQ